MTKIIKAYTLRMYPTLSQKELLEKKFRNFFLLKI